MLSCSGVARRRRNVPEMSVAVLALLIGPSKEMTFLEAALGYSVSCHETPLLRQLSLIGSASKAIDSWAAQGPVGWFHQGPFPGI